MKQSKEVVFLYVVNVDWFFISHRLPLAIEAIKKGYCVHVACRITEHKDLLISHGLIVHPLNSTRNDNSILASLFSIIELVKLFILVKPNLLHLVTIKPVLLGGIAARISKVPSVVAAISGLGHIYTSEGRLAKFKRRIVNILYSIALSHKNITVIFQNQDDRLKIKGISNINDDQSIIISGSGVNLDQYSYQPTPIIQPFVLMASRMLKDKGVLEFIEAARMVKKDIPSARFVLAGMIDLDNPAALTLEEISYFTSQGFIEYQGHQQDIPSLLNQASIVVLPSYREGMPKILLEASAVGRAIITTDVPGCRDAIINGITGILVPPKDSMVLASAIALLANSPEQCMDFGKAGRDLAVKKFDINSVISKHFDCYQSLLDASQN
jgi:glycosyltransferase involved in cell wall biosynthesis